MKRDKNYLEGRSLLARDPASVRVFNAKLRELEALILNERAYLSNAFRTHMGWEREFVTGRSNERLAEFKRQHAHFTFLLLQARGKQTIASFSVEEIKEVDPELFLGTPAHKNQKFLNYRCPLHEEKTPSFVWYRKTRSWFCYGACQAGGDVISLYQKLNQVTFVVACQELKKLL